MTKEVKMKTQMIKVLVVLYGLMFFSVCQAGTWSTAGQVTEINLQPTGDNSLFPEQIFFNFPESSISNCSSKTLYHLIG